MSNHPLDSVILLKEVRLLIQKARSSVAQSVNALQVLTNFEIGRLIVIGEQKGASRAGYGKSLIQDLSHQLSSEFGKGFSATNLKLMRKFYTVYQSRISQKPSDLLLDLPLTTQSNAPDSQSFSLSWSHYVLLITIKNSEERSFYEIESQQQQWSVPELKRQLVSSLYERLSLSRNKQDIKKLATVGQVITSSADLMKEPYVLEFLGLEEKASYSESDLEQGIIDQLEHFLLELGKGFLFEARQRRFTFDEDHYWIDLVFYNRLLRCYVLVDLKLDKITHQDLGQMQMYVNYFDRYEKLPDENPTIGILLCKRKKEALVELTLPQDSNIHAKEYQLYLPSKELLKKKLNDWHESLRSDD